MRREVHRQVGSVGEFDAELKRGVSHGDKLFGVMQGGSCPDVNKLGDENGVLVRAKSW